MTETLSFSRHYVPDVLPVDFLGTRWHYYYGRVEQKSQGPVFLVPRRLLELIQNFFAKEQDTTPRNFLDIETPHGILRVEVSETEWRKTRQNVHRVVKYRAGRWSKKLIGQLAVTA